MYYDQITGKLSKYGEGARKVVLLQRNRTYTKWVRNEETKKWDEVFAANGWEIVKELTVNAEGEALWNSWDADQRWSFLNKNYPHLLKEAAAAAAIAAQQETT